MSTGTWLDRTIGWLAPERGARRLAARAAMATLAGYEGARRGRRTEGWVTASTAADAAGELDWTLLRDRARDLVRNNPHAARAINVQVSHTIGTGITADVNHRGLEKPWQAFVENADLDGDYDLNGLFEQMERCRFESGECLVRFYRSGVFGRAPVPTQIRILEPEYLDSSRDTWLLAREAVGSIRHGIQRDEWGRVEGYWLFPEHPGERVSTARVAGRGLVSEFVPAEDVIHVFRKLRPGQTRGVSEFAPIMLRLRDLDDYDDAEIMRKKIEACLVGVLTTTESLGASALGPQTVEGDFTQERMQPATWYRARPGESVTFNTPQGTAGYADYKKLNQRDVAAGLGIPYELMTGDLSELNYTSMRGGLIDFRKRVQALQWLLYVPRVCRRIEARFLEDMRRLRPGLGDRTVFDWTPPKFELMDPMKETQAALEQVLAGFEPYDEIARANGWSTEELLDKIQAWFEALDRRGIKLKSDPRNQIQSHATPRAPEEPKEEAA